MSEVARRRARLRAPLRRPALLAFALSLAHALSFGVAGLVHAGAFIFARDNGADIITHPQGYTGTGGVLTVSVCIDQTSQFTTQMEYPVQQAIARWNAREPQLDNLRIGADNDIPSGLDFESYVLHELGHCIGLDHTNAATESLLPFSQQDSTIAQENTGGYEVDAGSDGVYGTADDLRGDDVNLHWFEKGVNDPFTLASVVDGDTYSRLLSDLPGGDLFAANATRDLAALQTLAPSEAVMNQGGNVNEAQRLLGHDDVAMISLAEAGLDEDAGTADDYELVLTYGGIADRSTCDVPITFDPDEPGLAVCNTTGFFIGLTDHVRLGVAEIFFNPSANWYFTRCGDGMLDVQPFGFEEECDDGGTEDGDGCSHTCRIEAGSVCSGEPSVCLLPAVPLAAGRGGASLWWASLVVLLGGASFAILWGAQRTPAG